MLLAAAEIGSVAVRTRVPTLLEYIRNGGNLPGMRQTLDSYSLPELPRVVSSRRMVRAGQLTIADRIGSRQSSVGRISTRSEMRSQ